MRKLIVTVAYFAIFLLVASTAPVMGQTETAKDKKEDVKPKSESIEGKWFGSLDVGPMKLRLVVDVENKEGKTTAIMTSLDQGNAKLPFDWAEFEDSKFAGKIAKIGGAFEAKLSGDKLEGEWTQLGQRLPLKMKRIKEVPVDDILSVWRGELKTPLQNLELQFRLIKSEDGGQKLVFDSLSQGATGIPSDMETDGDDVTIKIPAIGAKYVGTKDNDTVTGTWTQAGSDTPLVLKMVESAKTEMSPPERPQHPKRPFPYREEFVEFDGGADGVKLAGTITLPEKKEGDAAKGLKYPAVILVTGSGPQDRDETLMGHKPFLVIADHLTKKGIAVLRYDERGVGKSTGSFEEATSKDFATDVVAAIKFLAKHAEVDASRIGIVGHSEGGLIAPMVAAKHPELLKHIVLLAGPGIDGGEVLVGQSAAIYRAMEGGEDEIKKNVEIIKEVNQAIRDKMSDDDFDKMIEKISEHAAAEQSTDEELDEESQAMSVLTLKSRLSMFKTPWFRYFIEYDPATSLKDVKCSVLALNGEKDLQVLIEPNFQGIRSALESGGNKDFELVAYPELNHLFQKSKTGSPSEYSVLTETFSVDVMDKIADWVHAH